MENYEKNRYLGKKSCSFGIFLLISLLVILFVAVGLPLIFEGSINITQWIIISVIVIPIIVLFLWWWLDTYYIIDHYLLIVKWGPFKWKVDINDISIIRLNQKTLGGTWKLTSSWDCIEIEYKKNYENRSIFITPDKQDDFIKHLKSIKNTIEIR